MESNNNPSPKIDDESMQDYCFPKKPKYEKHNRIKIYSNYFRFEFKNHSFKTYFKYIVEFTPDLPGDAKMMRRAVVNSARSQISQIFGNYLFNNNTLYAREMRDGDTKIETKLKNGQEYSMNIKWISVMETNSKESSSLLRTFFFKLVKKLNWVPMRRNFYDPKSARSVPEYKFEVWTGFNPTINILKEGILINLDITHKVLRQTTALEEINRISSKNQSDNQEFRNQIQEFFKGTVVYTKYSNFKTYIIDGVDFDTKPTHTFKTKEGEVSYIEYYKTKYGINISKNQPLLIHKDKKGKLIHLIPDHSYMTGITEEMRNNFQLMAELAKHTKGSATDRVTESLKLIDSIKNNVNCAKEIDRWGIEISRKMVETIGAEYKIGNMQMGKNSTINADKENLDRATQREMYSQPDIRRWTLIYGDRDDKTAKKFYDTFTEVIKTFNYKCEEPKWISIPNNRSNGDGSDWRDNIREKTDRSTQMIVCIIPGARQKGPLYKTVKSILVKEYPVPSQIILAGTIERGKNVRSVVNKLLIQMCSKIGGVPWIIKDLPLTRIPVMIVSWETYAPQGKKPMFMFIATYNSTFTKYISLVRSLENVSEDDTLEECIRISANNFNILNKFPPQHVIVFRDSTGIIQIKMKLVANIRVIKNTIRNLCDHSPKLTFIALNKKSNVKLFYESGSAYTNCPPGTVIDENVVDDQLSDFYLISQKTTQGVAQPVHYYMAYDDFGVNPNDIYSLIFKLTHLYFNWTGGVKVPAPCQYVKKLSQLVGEKLSDKNSMCKPHERFENDLKTLYFL